MCGLIGLVMVTCWGRQVSPLDCMSENTGPAQDGKASLRHCSFQQGEGSGRTFSTHRGESWGGGRGDKEVIM